MRSLVLRVFFKAVLSSIFFLGLFAVHAQIVDDSTQLVYGTTTTQVFYESDLLLNTDTTYALDTAITGLEQISFVEQNRPFYTNLGNLGTAAYPLFWPTPDQIGRTSGFHSFDPFMPTAASNPYYNTKSPFIDLFAQIGGQGRNIARVDFTQNINENWNFGVGFQRLTSDKQLGAETNEFDRNVINTTYDFHMVYQHPKVPYKVMGYLSGLIHNVDEVGGVFFTDSSTTADKFQYRDAVIRLEDATSAERRLNLHLYQEYGFFEQFQLYHRFDRNRQEVSYTDFRDGGGGAFDTYSDFYDNFFIDADSTYERTVFTELINEAGLKGSLGSVYYRFYVRNRILDHEYLYDDPFETTVENYLGGESYFRWRDVFKVTAFGEFLQGGEFKLGGTLQSDLLEASYKTVRYNQSYLAQSVFNNHFSWRNNFEPGLANEIDGRINLQFGNLEVRPSANLTTRTNMVYFDTARLAQQIDGSVLITRIGTDLNFSLFTNKAKGEAFHLENSGYFTTISGGEADVVRIPRFIYNGRVYWKGLWFEDALPTEIGVNLYGRSGYFVNAYNPVFQQFHLQDQERNPSYLAADVFLNMQIDKLYVFVKMKYANQPADDGYFITFAYPGQARVLDLGVRWLFFD